MPLPRPRFAVLLLALVCVASPLAADDTGQPRGPLRFAFATYGIEQGLESLSTMDLLEDKAGNIWVATQEGVVRFDGDRFQTFGRTQGLPSPVVFDLEQDGDGLLWAGTLRGLARLDGSHFVATELPGSAAGESVEALALDGFAGEIGRAHV